MIVRDGAVDRQRKCASDGGMCTIQTSVMQLLYVFATVHSCGWSAITSLAPSGGS